MPDRIRSQAAVPPGRTAVLPRRTAVLFVLGLAIPAAAVMLLGWLAPPPFSESLYGNLDGQWAAHNARAILAWGTLFDLSPFNPLSGLGSMFLPNLPWLNPAALLLALPDRDLAYLLSYLVYLAELGGSIYLLARVLGAGPAAALLAALLHVFFLFPPFDGTFGGHNWYTLAPVYAQLSALLNLALALYLLLDGQAAPWRNLLRVGGILLAAALAFFTAPVTLLVFAPFYIVLGAFLTFADLRGAGRWQTLGWRAGVALAALVIVWASGLLAYYRATGAVSARVRHLPPEGWLDWFERTAAALFDAVAWQQACRPFGETICGGGPIVLFQLLALAGGICWLLQGGGRHRRAAGLFYLLFVPATLVYVTLLFARRLGALSILSPGFLSWTSYTLVAILAAALLAAAGALAWRLLRRRGAPDPGRWALPLGAALAILLLWGMHSWLHPLVGTHLAARTAALLSGAPVADQGGSNPVIAAAEAATALRPGAPFRGRVASFMSWRADARDGPAAAEPAPADFMVWLEALGAHRQAAANRHWGVDLWERDIPTLGDYGQWITTLGRAFVDRLLHVPVGNQSPNYLIASRVRPDILRLLGVSVVLSDRAVAALEADVLATAPGGAGGTLHAYRLAGANLGDYSPVRAVPVASLEAMAARIDGGGVDLRDEVFVMGGMAPPDLPWRRAEAVRLQFVRDGFRIAARADGPALLLLPLQYSACWRVRAAESPAPPVWIGRGDAILTLIAFDGALDARFDFAFGLGADADCRLRDAAEMAAWLQRQAGAS